MKITKETKFDVGQTVYVVWDNEVIEATVVQPEIVGLLGEFYIEYILGGNFIRGHVLYPNRKYHESAIYATKAEAVEALNHKLTFNITESIRYVKSQIRSVVVQWQINQCQTEQQRECLRVLRKANSDLIKLLKEQDKK